MAEPRRPAYQMVDGMRVSVSYSPERIREALNFRPKPGDIVLVSYPKCGTHWVKQIIQLLLHRGESAQDYWQFQKQTPFLEMAGTKVLEGAPSPRDMLTHLPFDEKRFNKDAKYVYVSRNPKDCAVSFYHHTRMLPEYQFEDGEFSDFLDIFLKGETEYGDYFDHVLPWYQRRHEPNVFFVTYEQLKKDIRAVVLKLAYFLGEKYGQMLEQDEQMFRQVLAKSDVQFMKKLLDVNPEKIKARVEKDPNSVSEGFKVAMLDKAGGDKSLNFVRKGQVGDWKGHFTKEQSERMRARVEEKVRGSDLMELWKEHDLGF
ncbi:sulfotransferase ssu-1 [Ixodes scapularis]